MSKKRTIRLTESELKQIISESVKRVLRESVYDSNDEFTSSMTSNMAGNNMQQQTSNFRHVDDLDQASRKAIVDRIERVCTTKDGYFDADEYRLEKEFNMSSDEMEKKGIWDIVRRLVEIALEGGYLY